MNPATPEQLANTRPPALREVLRSMPHTIAPAVEVVSEVTGHYIAAAYFTDTGDTDQPDTTATLAPDAAVLALADCARFMHTVGADALIAYERAGGDLAQLGHDFWLTRNRQGAGFWDRENLETEGVYAGKGQTLGEYLTECAQSFGERALISGDDGLLHLE